MLLRGVDKTAAEMKYKDYVEMSTAQRYQEMSGERGALFRDPPDVKKAAKSYKAVEMPHTEHVHR
jgi:hypothetical protein